MTTQPSSARTRVRRASDRGAYDRATIDAILDAALTCNVAFVRGGRPVVIPTIHARLGDTLYLHGSPATGYVRDIADGEDACVTVTLVDGLVLARSAFHHSMNYRSVVVHGQARRVTGREEMLAALQALVEHVMPGRWPTLRPIREDELRQTNVLAIGIDEASAKTRSGPVIDDPADLDLPIWAGVLPLRQRTLEPIADANIPAGVEVPVHVERFVTEHTTIAPPIDPP